MSVSEKMFNLPDRSLQRSAYLKYKQELALVREQNIDITHFEDLRLRAAKNYNSASDQLCTDEIDKAIKRMEEVKSS